MTARRLVVGAIAGLALAVAGSTIAADPSNLFAWIVGAIAALILTAVTFARAPATGNINLDEDARALTDGLPALTGFLIEQELRPPDGIGEIIKQHAPRDPSDLHRVRTESPPPTPQIVVTGAPGVGKSVVLARLADFYRCRAGRRVVFLKVGGRGVSGDSSLTSWIARQLDSVSIRPEVFQSWVTSGSLILVLDGLDELDRQTRADTLVELATLKARNRQNGIILSCRTPEWNDLRRTIVQSAAYEVWPTEELMPPLVHARLQRVHLSELSPTGQHALKAACGSPLILDYTLQLHARGHSLIEASSREEYNQEVIAQFVAMKFASDVNRTESHRLGHWISLSLGDRGTTLNLGSVTPQDLPAAVETRTRLMQLAVMAVPYAVVLLTAGVVLDLGWLVLPTTAIYFLLVFGFGATPIARRVSSHRQVPRVIADRRWHAQLVPVRWRSLPRRTLALRALAALTGGAIVGLLLGLATMSGFTDWAQRPIARWTAIAIIPIAAAVAGGLGVGLIGGLVGAIAFGLKDNMAASLVGGLCSGMAALLVFVTRDLGDWAPGFTHGELRHMSIRRRLQRSWRVDAFADMRAWVAMGLIYGFASRLATGNIQWFWHGLIAGLVGGAFFVLVGGFSPWSMLVAVQNGLRHSSILGSSTLDEAVDRLLASDLLVPASGGSSIRFRHPLVQEHFRRCCPDPGMCSHAPRDSR
jgi:hypothetical protein